MKIKTSKEKKVWAYRVFNIFLYTPAVFHNKCQLVFIIYKNIIYQRNRVVIPTLIIDYMCEVTTTD